jgi:quercetin dioxygenase-like cupin family protein
MNHEKLKDMVNGWFVGAFKPTALDTEACEVAVKSYKGGDCERTHFHKIATEVTLVLSGRVRMKGREWEAGDIIVLEPGEATDFHALTDATNVVVKVPSVKDDKYIVE